MRKLAFITILCCCHNLLSAQVFNSMYEGTSIPANQAVSTSSIATFINNNFNTDSRKAAAIYNWVTSNIRYDKDSANRINLGPDPEAKITEALRRRKGVCENFAAIFTDICLKAGLTSFVVDGYTKQNGFIDKAGHSWCAVLLNNEWKLCDPTWDVGGLSRWYLRSPAEMINTHMPFDPMWQLLEKPVSHRAFEAGTGHYNNQNYFNYRDSIAAYIKMDSLERYRVTAYRIEKSGIYNDLVKNRHQYNRMNIEIIRQDRDVELYNAAVADYNAANTIYNNFARYRNDQFLPQLPDKEISTLLDGIDTKILQANANLDAVERSAAVFKFSTEDLRDKLKSLALRTKGQQEFLNAYLAADKQNRPALLYNRKGLAGK